MYEVFSMNRAGNPRWAVVATAILFLLTTVIAGLISHQKSRQAEIILGDRQVYPALYLQAGFPQGWEVEPAEAAAGGQVLVASDRDSRTGRHLVVFRLRPSMLGPRQLTRATAVLRAIGAVDPDAQWGQPEREGPSRLGGLDSEMYELMVLSPVMGEGLQGGLANVASTSDRYIVGVLLITEGRVTGRDRRLVEAFSDSVVYQPPPPRPGKTDDAIDGPVEEPDDPEEIAPAPTARVY
jgi:hypothetical protein